MNRTYLGASQLWKLFDPSQYVVLVMEYQGVPREVEDSEAMWLGRVLERAILDAVTEVQEYQPEFTDEELRLRVHPDALAVDGSLVEVKTTGLAGPVDREWESGLPRRVWIQVQGQLMVSRAPRCMVVALIGGVGIRKFLVEPDEGFWEELCVRVRKFWVDVASGACEHVPEESGGEEVFERVELDSDDLLARYCELSSQIAELEKERELLRAEILGRIKSVGDVVSPRFIGMVRYVETLRVNTKKCLPSQLEKVVYRRLVVKEVK